MVRLAETRRDEGFDAAFAVLFPRAFRLSFRLLGDRAAAEDAAAEAMARAFADWKRVSELPYREAWILRVASNIALDQIRRRKLPVVVPSAVSEDEDTHALRVALWAALHALPRRQREIVVLRYIAGLTEPEVAQLLGISLGTVKTHVTRGRAALRRMIRDDEEKIIDLR
ncbi:MAG: sigma-70 family RNA polymerase sigma factor [Actinobacteria bacterium]|nr:MAG: sigma-70 family RNA polymerase sigma factor [Actinomycetota bacterium]